MTNDRATVEVPLEDLRKLHMLALWAFSEISEGTGTRDESLTREMLERIRAALDPDVDFGWEPAE